MKKKIYMLSIILIMIISSMAGCARKSDTTEEISMKIKEGSLTNMGATVVITDFSIGYVRNTYGEWFKIQRLEEGEWIDAKVISKEQTEFIDLSYYTKDNILEMDTEWEWIYGALPSGTYRIVKTFTKEKDVHKNYLYTEFTL